MLSPDEHAAAFSLRQLLNMLERHQIITAGQAKQYRRSVDVLVSGLERRAVALSDARDAEAGVRIAIDQARKGPRG